MLEQHMQPKVGHRCQHMLMSWLNFSVTALSFQPLPAVVALVYSINCAKKKTMCPVNLEQSFQDAIQPIECCLSHDSVNRCAQHWLRDISTDPSKEFRIMWLIMDMLFSPGFDSICCCYDLSEAIWHLLHTAL